jgi:hypothetical protein
MLVGSLILVFLDEISPKTHSDMADNGASPYISLANGIASARWVQISHERRKGTASLPI